MGKLYVTQKKECSSLYEPNIELMSKYENPERFKIMEIIDVELEGDNFFAVFTLCTECVGC